MDVTEQQDGGEQETRAKQIKLGKTKVIHTLFAVHQKCNSWNGKKTDERKNVMYFTLLVPY